MKRGRSVLHMVWCSNLNSDPQDNLFLAHVAAGIS
jgi:hypothetical protein